MFKDLTRYGAVVTKVRALYGRLLTPADWTALGEVRSVPEVVSLLSGFPGWKEAVGRIPSGTADPAVVENALQYQLESEYERIFKFASAEDKDFLIFSVYRTEYRHILSTLRRILYPQAVVPDAADTGFIVGKERVDQNLLASARSFADVLDAAENSIYGKVLRTVPFTKRGDPDLMAAHVLLENCYYSAVWRYLTKQYKGSSAEKLREILGHEVDFLNLTHIMRLRRRFPASLDQLDELLIPVRWKLTDDFIRSLAFAPTDEEAMALLRSSRWKRYFEEDSLAVTDHNYELGLEAFSRRQIHTAVPSLCVPQAYLTLKSIECDRLTRVLEAARYHMEAYKVI